VNDVKGLSELEIVRAAEVAAAALMRGACENCGHAWRPRNPFPTVNRCPGCGIRGRVTYVRIRTVEKSPLAGS
jgi:uncharacterized OB-fold protein